MRRRPRPARARAAQRASRDAPTARRSHARYGACVPPAPEVKMKISLNALGSLLLLALSATSCTTPNDASDEEREDVANSESAYSTGFGLPFPAGAAYQITQGPQGNFSHAAPYNAYAVDFAMPIGSPVVASGAG